MEQKSPLNSPSALLAYQLDQICPARLLVLAPTTPPLITSWLEHHQCEHLLIEDAEKFQTINSRFDFVVVQRYLETMPKPLGLTQLGQIRNLFCAKIWVEVAHNSEWGLNDFLSLGFKRQAQLKGDVVASTDCYGYDLTTYNHVRSWNNPKYWANPENWNKNRW